MAIEYCSWCGNYRDLDYESGYCTVDGEYMCESCVEDNFSEEMYDRWLDGVQEFSSSELGGET